MWTIVVPKPEQESLLIHVIDTRWRAFVVGCDGIRLTMSHRCCGEAKPSARLKQDYVSTPTAGHVFITISPESSPFTRLLIQIPLPMGLIGNHVEIPAPSFHFCPWRLRHHHSPKIPHLLSSPPLDVIHLLTAALSCLCNLK